MADYSPMSPFLRSRLPALGRRFAPPLWGVLLTAAAMLLFFQLGQWQLHRAAYKDSLLYRHAERAHLPPLDWVALKARAGDVADLPVRLDGAFDNNRNVLLDNQMQGPIAGYHILTAFKPVGEGMAVLVDRGWVPADPDRRKLPAIPPAQATRILASAALPSAMFTVAAEDYQSRPLLLSRLDMGPLSQALGLPLQSFILRLDKNAPDGFTRDWSPAVNFGMGPEKHRAYAFQWFALMVAVFVVFVVVNSKKKSPSP